MRTLIVALAVTVLAMGVLMATPTSGWADEPVRITGDVTEVRLGDTPLQLIPTDQGVFIVQGELAADKLATVMLMEGARPVQIKVTPHTHTQSLVVHRGLEEQWEALQLRDATRGGDSD